MYEQKDGECKKHRNIKLESCDKWRNCLIFETIYKATKQIFEKLLAIKMTKTKVVMNKPISLSCFYLES